ncbi:MAG: hypothetical protein KJZ54_12545 [Phycisphaerales bacterium]|nr:hypothetical protein [Phycisphaerales bacterium]
MRTVNTLAAALITAAALTATANARNDWPITPSDWKSPLLSTYGQYYENAGGLHFHEGIDILVAKNTEFKAPAWMKDYWVRAVNDDGYNSGIVLAANKEGEYGAAFNVWHVKPEKDLLGKQVTAGMLMGKVQKFPVADGLTHLHLDWAKDKDSYGGLGLGKPADDALHHLTPPKEHKDTHKPTVAGVRFRVAEHDRLGTLGGSEGARTETERDDNNYFHLKTTGGPGAGAHIVGLRAAARNQKDGKTDHEGSADLDIIANAYDQWHKDGRRIGARKIGFQAKGVTAGANTGAITTVDFHGRFLGASQDYDALRNHDLLRALFSNDARTNSHDGSEGGKDRNARLAHWYTVTNADGTATVKKENMDLYWNSNVRKGEGMKWNTPSGEGNANDAAKNANALFPDDFYDVTITVEDYSGNTTTDTQRILLDNFIQTVELEKTNYAMGKPITIDSMLNFLPDAGVPLMLLTAHPDRNLPLSLQGHLLTYAPTNNDGELFNHTLSPLSEIGAYWLVADYDADDYFTRRLDAFDRFNVVPCPATLALFSAALLAAPRRRRSA